MNMLAELLWNILAELLLGQDSDKHISQGKHEHLFNTIYQL